MVSSSLLGYARLQRQDANLNSHLDEAQQPCLHCFSSQLNLTKLVCSGARLVLSKSMFKKEQRKLGVQQLQLL